MRPARCCLLLVALGLGGCAVGDFLAGAPSSRERIASTGIVARRCSGCHALPNPAAMTRVDWLAGLDRMHRRMQLPAAEWDSLSRLARPD